MGLSRIIQIYSMSKKAFHIIFIVYAVIAFLVALQHGKAVLYPTDDSPAWRHGLFLVVNITLMYGLLKRPRWLIWLVGILTLQQLYSHGTYAYMVWQKEHTIDWASIAIIIFLPVLFFLVSAYKKKYQA